MEYGTVIVSWDKMPATTISRVYAGHHQITLAILDNNGGNNCLHSKGGLHFGIRKRYLPLDDGTGVTCIPIGNEEEVPVQTQLSAGLKFKLPDVSEWAVDIFLLKNKMEILSDMMEVGSMPHDLFISWRNYELDSEGYDESQRYRSVRADLPMIANR